MGQSPIDIAIDKLLESADGDIRLALRTVLLQNVELQLQIHTLTEQAGADAHSVQKPNSLN